MSDKLEHNYTVYYIAGDFRESKYSWFGNIGQFVVFIFVVAAGTAGKGR